MGMKKNKPNPSGDKGGSKNNRDVGNKLITDERFAKVHSDPRFKKLPKHKSKVAIDSRFSAMFTDKRFAQSSAPLDKRGKAKKKGETGNSLTRYYRMEEEEEEKKKKKKNIELNEESDGASTDSDNADDLGVLKSEVETPENDLGVLNSKPSDETSEDDSGSEEEVNMEDDASSTDTDTDEEGDVGSEEDADSEEVENVPVVEKETSRLAIVNMDWNEVKAADLFVVLGSFLPKGGQILSVAVYPSEFGLKRMEEEAIRGPAALFDGEEENNDKDSDSDSDGDDDGDDEIDNAKLRAYEKSRLRYYFAVVACDSVATADYLYKFCDGVEFERSSNVLDLRFIPDEMEFKHPPRDQATEAPAGYEGLDFHTRALQHSNVHLSWDEDEPHRVKTLNRKFNADQLADLELKEFLASDESESEEDGDETEDPSERKNKKCDKYRALIQSGDGSEEEEDEGQEMEVTFNTGLENISKKILERKDANSETVWEKVLKKRKEKKANKFRSKHSSDDDSDSMDDASVEEAGDFFEEEPPTKKSKKANIGKKKRTERKSTEIEKEDVASLAELELLLADDKQEENNVKGYKINKKKSKKGKKGKKEDLLEDKLPNVDLDDPRFAAHLNKPLFALDPTDPRFKRSATFMRQSAQQQKKGREELLNEELSHINKKSGSASTSQQGDVGDEHLKSEKSTSRDKLELSMLVKSVKMKSKQAASVPSEKAKGDGSSRKKRKHDK